MSRLIKLSIGRISILLLLLIIFPRELKGQNNTNYNAQFKYFSNALSVILNGNSYEIEEFANTQIKNEYTIEFINITRSYISFIELESDYGLEKVKQEIFNFRSRLQEKIKNKPDDIILRFYLGSALSYESVIESKFGSIWTAYRKGKSAVNEMKKCLKLDRSFLPPFLVIGSYNYWMGSKNLILKIARFLNNREKGIEQMVMTVDYSGKINGFGINQLIWVYLDKKDYKNAWKWSKTGIDEYPNSRFLLYPAAETAQRSGRFEIALDLYGRLVNNLLNDGLDNRYFFLKIKYKIAQIQYELGNLDKCIEICINIVNSHVITEDKKYAEKLKKSAQKLEKSSLNKEKK